MRLLERLKSIEMRKMIQFCNEYRLEHRLDGDDGNWKVSRGKRGVAASMVFDR